MTDIATPTPLRRDAVRDLVRWKFNSMLTDLSQALAGRRRRQDPSDLGQPRRSRPTRLAHSRVINDLTDGGFVALANEFEVAPRSAVYPHSPPTHEWYFEMSGRGS